MPVYPLTSEWSDPIELQAGDILQNHNRYAIEITAQDPTADPAVLAIPKDNGAFQVEAATTIRARALVYPNTLHVIRGF